MNGYPPPIGSDTCASACVSTSTVEALNRECFCLAVDPKALRAELEAVLAANGLLEVLAQSHPHLFSALPFYVSRRHIEQVARVVGAIEEVTTSPAYQSAVLSWAPDIAKFDPGSRGGLLGLDFHLTSNGPRLIEINTNPGGVLLNAILGQAQRSCMPELAITPTDAEHVEDAVLECMLAEGRLQRGSAPLASVAIVDGSPRQRYLYPEFVLFQELLRRHGYRAEICGPEELVHKQNRCG